MPRLQVARMPWDGDDDYLASAYPTCMQDVLEHEVKKLTLRTMRRVAAKQAAGPKLRSKGIRLRRVFHHQFRPIHIEVRGRVKLTALLNHTTYQI